MQLKAKAWRQFLGLSTLLLLTFPVFGTAASFFFVTHPTYVGKTVRVEPENILFRSILLPAQVKGRSWIVRSSLDSQCQRKCALLNGQCKVSQTYWTGNNSFVCELLNTSLCYACPAAVLTRSTTDVLEGHIWECNPSSQALARTPCIELSSWQIKGNCSQCGKIGYYGRNCSLRASCQSYYYEPGSNMSINNTSAHPISPCFAQGKTYTALCRGPYTMWFSSAPNGSSYWWDRQIPLNFSEFLGRIPDQMELAGKILARESRLLVVAGTFKTPSSPLMYNYMYFSLAANKSLNLKLFVNGAKDFLLEPQFSAPFLQPYQQSCGPMWLLSKSVHHNSTHIDSCDLETRIFGTPMTLAKEQVFFISFYVDTDYFECD